MSTELRIFGPQGVPLDDITPSSLNASWILNDVGDASFEIATSDTKCSEKLLSFGNILLINDDDLPSWVGFIDSEPTREWGAGKIIINALSAEKVFNWRIVWPTKMSGTAGAILNAMLEKMMNWSEGGIKTYPGEIWDGGRDYVYPILGRAREVVDRLAKKSGCDWSISHEFRDGRIVLLANLYNGERGTDSDIVLDASNTELVEPVYSEEGEIYNHIVSMTPLNSGNEIIIGNAVRDEESIGKYSLRMWLQERMAEDVAALDWQSKAFLYDHAYPRGITMPNLIYTGSLSNKIDLGNSYRWENHGAGFEDGLIGVGDKVRLTGFETQYMDGKVAATLESTKKPFSKREFLEADNG